MTRTSDVISLFGGDDLSANPTLQRIESYWESLRAGRTVPLRADVDPHGLQGVLDSAFMLERIAPRVAQFRVAGRRFSEVMGMDLRGLPLSACFLPDARGPLGEATERLFSAPAILRGTFLSPSGFGRPALTADLVLLPLADSRGDITRAMGGIALSGRLGRTPRRFEIVGTALRQLRASDAPKGPGAEILRFRPR
ncbi:MAG: PAS domain-containing protein [Pseudomonadota bacterium]